MPKKLVSIAAFLFLMLPPYNAWGRESSEVWSQPLPRVAAALRAEKDINAGYSSGLTPLMYASRHNTAEVVAFLLQNGANPNMRDDTGMSAIMHAARYNPEPDVIKALAAAGAELNLQNVDGRTALILAAQKTENHAVLRELLLAGADPFVKDSKGCDAMFYAKKNASVSTSATMKTLQNAAEGKFLPPPASPPAQSPQRANEPERLLTSLDSPATTAQKTSPSTPAAPGTSTPKVTKPSQVTAQVSPALPPAKNISEQGFLARLWGRFVDKLPEKMGDALAAAFAPLVFGGGGVFLLIKKRLSRKKASKG